MQEKQSRNLAIRFLDFVVKVIKGIQIISKSYVGRQIAGQLIRSSTSAGANYEEACAAESRSDFIHKLQMVLIELRESSYWLKLISKASLIPSAKADVLIKEAPELSNIIAKSVVTAERNRE